ncbi:hypothetical protein QBC40DRAFT_300718 [Triangularia verruculosa]|uniref:Uncharacterized protein n=1 Tax=Triangularia verruculosa TaxID=2587418 RepID=A0AAN7AP44_9PEZI|nr:hypothetical protein QBC40DRAFT_300718 [Triangularia verruculosa]
MEPQSTPTPEPKKICKARGCEDPVHEDAKYCHTHRCDYDLSSPRCEDRVRHPSWQYCKEHFQEMRKIWEKSKKETEEQIKKEEERKRCGGWEVEMKKLREELKQAEEELSKKKEDQKRVEEEGTTRGMSGALASLENRGQ